MVVCSSVLVLRPFCHRYFPGLLGRDTKASDLAIVREDTPNFEEAMGPRSKNEYWANIKKRNSNSRGRSRNLWSISFANTTKGDDEDLESLDTEMRRLPPTAAAMDGNNAENFADHKEDYIVRHEKPIGGGAPPSPVDEDVLVLPAVGGDHADLESGTTKKVSHDVVGQAF